MQSVTQNLRSYDASATQCGCGEMVLYQMVSVATCYTRRTSALKIDAHSRTPTEVANIGTACNP
jgi:hypothetical protein